MFSIHLNLTDYKRWESPEGPRYDIITKQCFYDFKYCDMLNIVIRYIVFITFFSAVNFVPKGKLLFYCFI